MKFSRLNKDSELVKNLRDKSWWKMIVDLTKKDENFNVQIRGDSINVYYKMANFLKISNNNNNPIAEIHYKYLPTKSDGNKYVRIDFDNNIANLKSNVEVIKDDIFSNDNIKKIKDIIDKYNSKREKGYQSELIKYNYPIVLDAEIAYTDKEDTEDKNGRIDIMVYNKNTDEIIAVEFKVITDSRLFNNEIKEQLERYKKFMSHKDIIRKAYIDTVQTKKYLGLIDEKSPLLKINNNTKIVEYPILAITTFDQALITKYKDKIKENVKDIAYSLNMFGMTGDLLKTNSANNECLMCKNYK